MLKLTDEQNALQDNYLPPQGDGDTQATQAVTALCKLVYRWYNDGDIYDNHYSMQGWANDISGSANWLYKHIPATQPILEEIYDVVSDDGYELILRDLTNVVLDAQLLSELDQLPKDGDAYMEDGPFSFDENLYEDEEEEYYEDDEDDDYPWG